MLLNRAFRYDYIVSHPWIHRIYLPFFFWIVPLAPGQSNDTAERDSEAMSFRQPIANHKDQFNNFENCVRDFDNHWLCQLLCYFINQWWFVLSVEQYARTYLLLTSHTTSSNKMQIQYVGTNKTLKCFRDIRKILSTNHRNYLLPRRRVRNRCWLPCQCWTTCL